MKKEIEANLKLISDILADAIKKNSFSMIETNYIKGLVDGMLTSGRKENEK